MHYRVILCVCFFSFSTTITNRAITSSTVLRFLKKSVTRDFRDPNKLRNFRVILKLVIYKSVNENLKKFRKILHLVYEIIIF